MKEFPVVVTSGGFIAGFKSGQLHLSLVKLDDSMLSIAKGHLEDGESIETAALREIGEEVGNSEFEIVEKVGELERMSKEESGKKVKKEIHVFAMKIKIPLTPKPALVWKTIDDAIPMMKFKEEAEFLKKNKAKIEDIFRNKL